MNRQAIRTIDSVIGLVVLLLLAVAVIAGQAYANLPRDTVYDSNRNVQSGTSVSSIRSEKP